MAAIRGVSAWLVAASARIWAAARAGVSGIGRLDAAIRGQVVLRAGIHAGHVLVSLAADGKPEEAEGKAQAALARLRKGEDFGALAKELSDDPGSAAQGGDLGWFERGVMVKEFEDVAFGLPAGQVSEPVRSPFGLHLIEVTEIRESDQPSLDAVRERVVQALQRAEAEKLYYDQAERLSDLAYENAGSLDPAAEVLQALVVGTRDYVRKNGFREVVIALSGGIDSALVAAVAVEALGKENVAGVFMPTRYSSEHSREDATQLAENLGIRFEILPIKALHDRDGRHRLSRDALE